MNPTIALQMVGADFLKLRKRIGNVAVATLIAYGPLLIYFIVRAVQHSSNAIKYPPAGGDAGFTDALRLIALFFGPLAAILIGVDGGATDSSARVFRDLVVTGRSRLALFASRAPAALGLTWLITISAYGLLLIGTFAFASGGPTPAASLILNGLGFSLLSTGVLCTVAVGLASLATSRATALTILIGWQLVASPILGSIGSLGSARKALLSQGIVHFSPVHIGDRNANVTMGTATALIVIAAWLVVFLALGARRTQRMDA